MKLRRLLIDAVGWTFSILVLGFLLLPVVIVIPVSFSDSDMFDFPPKGFTMRWYEALPQSREWLEAAAVSLRIAIATAVIATVVALLVGLSHFLVRRLTPSTRTFFILPLIVPHIILSVGLFNILVDVGGLGWTSTVIVINVAIALPLVIQLLINAFDTIDPLLWTAGVSLGGKPGYVLRKLILPLVSMSVLAALILAFQSAWDETTFAVFIGPATKPPLSSRLFAYLQHNVTPEVAAIVTLLLLVTAVGALAVAITNARQKARLRMPAAD